MKTIYVIVVGEEFVPEAFDTLLEANVAAEKLGDQMARGPWQIVIDDHSEMLLRVCHEAEAVGKVMKERLELNNLAGEEDPFIADAENLIALAKNVIEELKASA